MFITLTLEDDVLLESELLSDMMEGMDESVWETVLDQNSTSLAIEKTEHGNRTRVDIDDEPSKKRIKLEEEEKVRSSKDGSSSSNTVIVATSSAMSISEVDANLVVAGRKKSKFPYGGDKIRRLLFEKLEEQYHDRVITNHGLALAIFDVLNFADPFIHPTDGKRFMGHVLAKVKFRVVLFSPQDGTTLEGNVTKQTCAGVYISLGFFDHIFVDGTNLYQDEELPEFNRQLQVWSMRLLDTVVWLAPGERVRFKCARVKYQDSPPMKIWATMNECGLGPVKWWK